MLRKILLVVLLALAEGKGVLEYCSKGCNCSESSAICDTINFGGFGRNILSLKIINPKLPLILKGQPFNVTGLKNLNYIVMENATIVDMDKSGFAELNSLYTLSVINSKINSLNNPLMFSKINIKKLKITNSSLSKFEYIVSSSLEEMDLSGNELKIITKNSFGNIPNLSYLNLANNLISEINPLAFSNLIYLQEINLSSNKITYLDPNILKNNQDLSTLDLSNNPIKNLQINIYPELEKLVLKSLNLQEFNQGLSQNLSLLSYLDLSNNNVKLTKTSFSNMAELEYIDLSNNNFQTLDSNIFKSNDEIQKIILDNNNFTVLPKFVSTYGNFDSSFFSCKNCNLTAIPNDAFEEFRALIILNLSQNKLNLDGTWLSNLPNLIDLDLSHNKIKILNQQLASLTSLSTINLSYNPIVTISTSFFAKNRVLNTLDLSNCNLAQFWLVPIEANVTSLRVVNIANNSIPSIQQNQLKATPNVKVFNLANNPLTCDENLRDSINWLNRHRVTTERNPWRKSEKMQKLETMGDFHKIKVWNWKDLAKERCSQSFYENSFNEEKEKENEVDLPKKAVEVKKPEIYVDLDQYYYYDEDAEDYEVNVDHKSKQNEIEIDLSDLALQSIHFKSQKGTNYSVLWPTLVFIFTALTVLVIVANVLLIMVRSKMIPRQVNLPHIKIPNWSNSKLKKHSGSVYRPLSEERAEMLTPIIIRKDHVPTHCNNTKPTL